MKKINKYIVEKLKLNKDINTQYNPDHLNNDKIVLYADDEEGYNYEDLEEDLNAITNMFEGFIVCRFKSLSEVKNFYEDNIINDHSDDLLAIKNRIITSKDLGYEIRLQYGHLEFDCINSGSRGTYYVYALNIDNYDKVEQWFMGDEEVPSLEFLMQPGNIQEIPADFD